MEQLWLNNHHRSFILACEFIKGGEVFNHGKFQSSQRYGTSPSHLTLPVLPQMLAWHDHLCGRWWVLWMVYLLLLQNSLCMMSMVVTGWRSEPHLVRIEFKVFTALFRLCVSNSFYRPSPSTSCNHYHCCLFPSSPISSFRTRPCSSMCGPLTV